MSVRAEPRRAGVAHHVAEGVGDLGRDTEPVLELRDEPQVLVDQVEGERHRRALRMLEGRPLVGDEGRRRGAGGEQVERGAAGHAGPLHQHQRLGQRGVQRVHQQVHPELQRRPGALGAAVQHPVRHEVEDGPDPLDVPGAAAGHDGQRAVAGEAHAAGDGGVDEGDPRGAQQVRRGRHRQGSDRAHVDPDRARGQTLESPVRTAEHRDERCLVREHAHDDRRPGHRRSRRAGDVHRGHGGQARGQLLGRGRAAVPDGELAGGACDALGHHPAHPAQPDEGDPLGGTRRPAGSAVGPVTVRRPRPARRPVRPVRAVRPEDRWRPGTRAG